jgi:NADH-quinone oxidoreductase subunit L
MRKFSGLRKVMPITHVTFLCGAVALAGVPFFSGFYSKDEILGAAFGASVQSANYKGAYAVLFILGLFTAGLTAFYTFRAYFLTFWGELKLPPEAGHHGGHSAPAADHGHSPTHGPSEVGALAPAHTPAPGQRLESPPVMTVPLMILAVFALFVGFVTGPLLHSFAHFLKETPYFPKLNEEEFNPAVLVGSVGLVTLGIGLAYWMYILRPGMAGRLAGSFQGLYQLSLNKFHVDELYDAFILRPLSGFAEFCRVVDQEVVDGLVDVVGEVPRLVGALFRPVQNGLVQFYALAMMLGLTVFLIALARSL